MCTMHISLSSIWWLKQSDRLWFVACAIHSICFTSRQHKWCIISSCFFSLYLDEKNDFSICLQVELIYFEFSTFFSVLCIYCICSLDDIIKAPNFESIFCCVVYFAGLSLSIVNMNTCNERMASTNPMCVM